jgi:hypothetical protein
MVATTMVPTNCGPRIRGGCPPVSERPEEIIERVHALELSLREFFRTQGIKPQDSKITDFAKHLAECESWAMRWEKLLKVANRLPETDILFWIQESASRGDVDEALWRGFVAGHFGRTSAEGGEIFGSSAKFLMGFGRQPHWTWERVSSNPESFKEWLFEHKDELRSLSYGNHRKYESQKPDILYRVFRTFLDWTAQNGGSPTLAFRTDVDESPESKFRLLYKSLRSIFRLGRTGAFDLLCLIGRMGLLPVLPDSCYLRGSTGPLKGARKLWGRRPTRELSLVADLTAKALDISYDTFEDALCVWQK